jgi:hypothetical protein
VDKVYSPNVNFSKRSKDIRDQSLYISRGEGGGKKVRGNEKIGN